MATYLLRPDGDLSADWTEVPPGTAWSVLNESVTQPTVPSTGSNYIESSTDAQKNKNSYTTSTLGALEGTAVITVWAYVDVLANQSLQAHMTGVPDLTLFGSSSKAGPFTGWWSVTYVTSATYNWANDQANINAIDVQYQLVEPASPGQAGVTKIYAAYVEVSTTNVVYGNGLYGGDGTTGTYADLRNNPGVSTWTTAAATAMFPIRGDVPAEDPPGDDPPFQGPSNFAVAWTTAAATASQPAMVPSQGASGINVAWTTGAATASQPVVTVKSAPTAVPASATASQPVVVVKSAPTVAPATATASEPNQTIAVAASVPAGAATASGPNRTASFVSQGAVGIATASQPPLTPAQGAGPVNVSWVTAAATASQPTIVASASLTVPPGTATASGPNRTASAALTVPPGVATASGPASTASASLSVPAANATASGPVSVEAFSTTVPAGLANATFPAPNPAVGGAAVNVSWTTVAATASQTAPTVSFTKPGAVAVATASQPVVLVRSTISGVAGLATASQPPLTPILPGAVTWTTAVATASFPVPARTLSVSVPAANATATGPNRSVSYVLLSTAGNATARFPAPEAEAGVLPLESVLEALSLLATVEAGAGMAASLNGKVTSTGHEADLTYAPLE